MADDTVLNPGGNGDVIRTIEKGGVKTQVVLLDVGGGGAESLMTSQNPLPVGGALGSGDIIQDAWGVQKMSLPYSLFHGMWTFDIPQSAWFMYENGTQVYTSTNIVSTNGAAVLTTSAAKSALILEGRRCPRYQPNRGHLFSTALWCPSKTADGVREWGLQTAENGVFFRLKTDGLLYAVQRSGGVETHEQVIDTSGLTNFDVQKGNVYDIQYQWRGVGNYKFFINLQLVHTFAHLGTLTALSMQNPALPCSFRATRTTADVSMGIGCADITSENGTVNEEEYGSAFAQTVTIGAGAGDKPIMVIYNPLQIGGKTNTRTVMITHVDASCTKKCMIKIWRTRIAAAITGATLVANGNGSFVQTDSTNMNAGAVRATAVNTANMQFVSAITVEANVVNNMDLSPPSDIEFTLVRGDYLVITSDAATASADAVIVWGEEI